MKATMLLRFGVLLCLLVPRGPARAESLDALFEQGNNEFWDGEYEKAADTYGRLEDLAVRSPQLSFNLATTHARLGNLGLAVLHYERAIAWDPDYEDAAYNLGAVREFIARRASEAGRDADLAPAVGPWRAVLDRFSPSSAAYAFLVVFLLLFAVLTTRRIIRFRVEMVRLSSGILAGVLAVLVLATGMVALGKLDQELKQREGVVIARETAEVVEGPGSSVERYVLEEGSRVQLLEDLDNWTKVRDDQGREGWLPASQVGEI